MCTVYALQSQLDQRIYVGLSKDLNKRLREHNAGYVTSTKGFRPWTIIFTEIVETRIEARNLEKKLKSGYGKEFLKGLNIRG